MKAHPYSTKRFFAILYILLIIGISGCGGGGGGGENSTAIDPGNPSQAPSQITTPSDQSAQSHWSTPSIVSSSPTLVSFTDIPVAVTTNGAATALLTWNDSSNYNIGVSSKLMGSEWNQLQGIGSITNLNNNGNITWPDIHADGQGNIFASWTFRNNDAPESRQADSHVYVSRYSSTSGAWTTPYLLQNDSAAHAQNIRLAVQSNGNAWAVWTERTFKDQWFSTNDKYAVFAAKYTPQGGWQTAEKVGGDYLVWQFSIIPRIDVDKSGNPQVIFTWDRFNGTPGEYVLLASIRSADSTWSSPTTLSTALPSSNATSMIADHNIAVDGNGNSIVIWTQYDGVRQAVVASRYTGSGGWTQPGELTLASNNDDGFAPQIAMDKNGNAIVVWHEFDGGSYGIWAARFDRNTGWASLDIINSPAKRPEEQCTFPKVEFDDAGNAIVVWMKYDYYLNTTIARANRYTPASGWAKDETISDPAAGVVSNVSLGVSPDGYATSTWWARKDSATAPQTASVWSASFAP